MGQGWSECLEDENPFSQTKFLPRATNSSKKHRLALATREFWDLGQALCVGLQSCDSSHQQCKITGSRVFLADVAHGRKWVLPLAALVREERGERGFVTLRAGVTSHRGPRWHQGVGEGSLKYSGWRFHSADSSPKEFLPCPSGRVINKSESLQELAVRKCLCCRAEPVVLWGCCQAARGAERGQNWGQALAPCPCHHPSASGTHPGVVSLWGY